MKTDIQASMFREMREKSIFELSRRYAFQYADESLKRKVFPDKKAIDDLIVFDEELPSHAESPEIILKRLSQYGSPATVSQIGGRYFGFVNGGVVPTALAAKWLADFWDQNAPLYVMSPILSKLETVVESWLKELFNLPQSTVAGFVSGSQTAILSGLAAARYRILKDINWDINTKGLFAAPKIRIVTSLQIHSSVLKAISILGLGMDSIEWVDTDSEGRIIPELIPELDKQTILILQAGNVNTGSFDPFDLICKKAVAANAWIHIDGAFGLWAAGSEELKFLTEGIELANSWSVDGHKTLNTPYDCGIILCKDKEALTAALQASASYLLYSDERDGMLYTPEMSRRGRIVELWATMKYLGKIGIDELVFGLHQRALQFAMLLKKVEGFEVLNDVVFNQVLVRCETDDITLRTLKKIQELNECWVGGSTWNGSNVIRISICSWATTADDIALSAESFTRALKESI